MAATGRLGLIVLVIGLAGTAAVLSNRLSARLRVPAPAFFLVAAAVVAELLPAVALPVSVVQPTVTVALAIILFDGGLHIGWRKFRSADAAIAWTGVAGTLVTAAGVALAARFVAGLDWRSSLLLGTAVSATDPAVVFSVFGRREIAGRTGTLLEGESGANDPVGISLLAALLASHGSAGAVAGHVAAQFAEQMGIGTAIGVAGGLALLAFMRRVPLPSEGLYSPRVLAGVLAIFGLAVVAQGSGFLAVFAAGIVIGDADAPYMGEIRRFHSSLASLAEITAFVMLGLTAGLASLGDLGTWTAGLAIAALLALVIRPVLVGLVALPVRLSRAERVFFAWTGLKGAVPVLLGTMIISSGSPGAARVYGIIFVIVAFSVTIQGGLVPALAHRLRIPLRMVEPEPWSLGVRFATEPEGMHRYRVTPGSPADGTQVGDLLCGEYAWISLIIRNGSLAPVTPETALQPDDDVLLLAAPEEAESLRRLFTAPAPPPPKGAQRHAHPPRKQCQ
jgi:cell volume regulation protein A